MSTLYGYAGKVLRVDLSKEEITEEKLDEAVVRKYIGGTGLGAKYLYDEVPAGVGWSDAANRLMLMSGPLGGTTVGGSGTISVVTKGALSNGAVASQANGFFGAFLRFAGYDGIIIQGKAKRWVYLYIDKDKVEIKDASHLVGKDTWDTGDLIKGEYGQSERGMSVASIGPAGENLVKFAAIFVDKGHAASHNGVGAVMGAKKLKAIAIPRGRSRPPLKDRTALTAIANQLHDNIVNNPQAAAGAYSWGTLNILYERTLAGDGIVPVKNYTTCIFDIEREKLEKFGGPYIRSHYDPKPNPCWACRMHHVNFITIPEGPYKGYVGEEPEYECFASFGPLIGNTDASVAVYIANEVDRLGMDCNEAAWVVGLAIECFEKGLLTLKETGQLSLNWGNYEAAMQLLRNIATRHGFGDVLAEGVMRAAQSIGGEAPNFAIHTMKGNTPRGHDHRNRWPMLFDTCVSQMSTDEGFTMLRPEELGITVRPGLGQNNSAEDSVVWNILGKGAAQFEDCLGTCRFTTRTDIKMLPQAVSAATGWDFSPQDAIQAGRVAINLLHAFNIRHGHTAEMDAPSPRYGSAPVDGPSQGKSILTDWPEMRRRYYEGMGWDAKTGKPLPDTLKKLGLEHTISELWGK